MKPELQFRSDLEWHLYCLHSSLVISKATVSPCRAVEKGSRVSQATETLPPPNASTRKAAPQGLTVGRKSHRQWTPPLPCTSERHSKVFAGASGCWFGGSGEVTDSGVQYTIPPQGGTTSFCKLVFTHLPLAKSKPESESQWQ